MDGRKIESAMATFLDELFADEPENTGYVLLIRREDATTQDLYLTANLPPPEIIDLLAASAEHIAEEFGNGEPKPN